MQLHHGFAFDTRGSVGKRCGAIVVVGAEIHFHTIDGVTNTVDERLEVAILVVGLLVEVETDNVTAILRLENP